MKLKTFLKFSAPSNFVMIVLLIIPLIIAFGLGLNYLTYNNFNDPLFVGFDNYVEIFEDPFFWDAFRWTLTIIAIAVPGYIIIAFIEALLLDQIVGKLRGVYLALMLLPMILVPVIATNIFRQLFEPTGLAGWLLRLFTGDPFVFNEFNMKALIVIHTIWGSTPFAMVVFFAGMQTLPKDLVDASAIDGATRWQQIWNIVIPHLRSLFLLNAIIAVMDFFRLFDNVFVLTRMNPIFHADTLQTYLFRITILYRRLGLSNAGALVTVLLIMIVLVPFLIFMYREQIEER